MTNVPLKWVGALDADASTEYVIASDETTPGTFVTITTQPATSPYAPVSATLNGAITESTASLIMTDATNFSNGNYSSIDREMILLGGKSTNTFATNTRGINPTIREAHSNLATIYKAHESYSASVTFATDRHLIRFRITRKQGTDLSPVTEIFAFNPSAPPTSHHTVLFGVLRDTQGNPKSGKVVTAQLQDDASYDPGLGDLLYVENETDTTDVNGYWEIALMRNVDRNGGNDLYTIVIDSGGSSPKTYTDRVLPDQAAVYFFNAK